MTVPPKKQRYQALVLAHMDSAFNLAFWLTRSRQDAEDIVQEAYLRAYKFFDGFHGDDGRAWLLAIVRNTFYSTWRKRPPEETHAEIDEDSLLWGARSEAWDLDPAITYARKTDRERIDRALMRLPLEFREVVILRELEDLSYREIAEMLSVPSGTVMSRLSRARALLARYLRQED